MVTLTPEFIKELIPNDPMTGELKYEELGFTSSSPIKNLAFPFGFYFMIMPVYMIWKKPPVRISHKRLPIPPSFLYLPLFISSFLTLMNFSTETLFGLISVLLSIILILGFMNKKNVIELVLSGFIVFFHKCPAI